MQRAALDAIVKRLLFQAPAIAVVAGGIGTVAAEEDADVHLVGARFLPFEKAAHPIPLARVVSGFGITAVAFDDPFFICGTELIERQVNIHAAFLSAFDEIVLAVFVGVAAECLHQTFADAE